MRVLTKQLRSRIAQPLNVRTTVRFGLSLAAALLNGLFEHPWYITSLLAMNTFTA